MTDRDYKAEYGSQQHWELQRKKQERIAENRDERLHGKIINKDE